MPAEQDLRAAADHIEALLGELAALGDPRARAKAEELVRLLMRLYGEGIHRILEIVHEESGAASDRFFSRLADDSLVSSLLVLHGLHPLDVETRVLRALDRVRPYLGSHGGDVKLLGVEGGVVRLRLEGSCHGCPSSTVTMKLAIESAIEEAAPEVTGIEVEGAMAEIPEIAEPVPPAAGAAAAGGLLQIGQHGQHPRNGQHGQSSQTPQTPQDTARGPHGGHRPADLAGASWIALGTPPQPGPGGLAALDLPGVKVVVCKVDEAWYAYRDSCPSCGSLLAGGALEREVLACPACGCRYDVRRAGGCVDGAGPHLEPLPLLAEQGALKIAVPGPAA
jgi:Fe-S cluster biogenesis protein NfuA/nitrite reductase/ring-hydroxylating ferredoxin subunit